MKQFYSFAIISSLNVCTCIYVDVEREARFQWYITKIDVGKLENQTKSKKSIKSVKYCLVVYCTFISFQDKRRGVRQRR